MDAFDDNSNSDGESLPPPLSYTVLLRATLKASFKVFNSPVARKGFEEKLALITFDILPFEIVRVKFYIMNLFSVVIFALCFENGVTL